MNLFDNLVNEALKNTPELTSLKIVVEKELLHHDILRILSRHNLLHKLTFIGGTALRVCYGGVRLSEDLDFTGGSDFSRESLMSMGEVLETSLHEKYGLRISVTPPIKDTTNVDTWKVKIVTRPKQKNLPSQRINIDICSVQSYDRQPMVLINPYGVDMGTSGLIIQTQSQEEIYADKLLAFALRPNRLKYRDLWDIIWLHQQGITPNLSFIPLKLDESQLTLSFFLDRYKQRANLLSEDIKLKGEFQQEMHRFLPAAIVANNIVDSDLWPFLEYHMQSFYKKLSAI